MNTSGRYIQQLTGYKAFMPNLLPLKNPVDIDQDLLKATEKKLAQLDGVSAAIPNPQLFISMYVRKEALLSSQIEGTQATYQDVLVYETWENIENFDDVEEVVNYIKALNHGTKRLSEFPMSVRIIKEMHEILMRGVRGANKGPGFFRTTQNWIGPGGLSLKHAVYVPPPPGSMLDLLSNLEKYMHADGDEHPLIKCALIHYQFETVHPFLDGNGRLGRLMIMLYLLWQNYLSSALLYPSLFFKLYKQEYFDRLDLVRKNGDYKQWVEFFLKALSFSADHALKTAQAIIQLQTRSQKHLMKANLRSPHSFEFLDALFISPIFSIQSISEKLNVSFQTATNLTKAFVKLDLVQEITKKKRNQRFAFAAYLRIIDNE